MPRHALPIVFCLMLAAGGCARTGDGSVVIPGQLDMRRADLGPLDLRHWGHMRPEETQPVLVPAPPETFPVSPQATATGRPRVKTTKPAQRRTRHAVAHKAQALDESPSNLACEQATQAGKRVRVLCE